SQLTAHLGRLLDASERDRMGTAAAATVGEYEWQQVFARAEKLIFPG
ncbi:MAG: hypothetical protein QOC66_2916, partial [Pseudonocardiales bacterium]|nr:hypothetical protein [Pseudonocardiales bacterium]